MIEPGRQTPPPEEAAFSRASSARSLPRVIEPMLPSRAPEPFDSAAHVFEVLWDGIRALIFVERGSVRVQDRFGRDITHRFPELQPAAARVREHGVVLDGEIVCLDAGGRPDFARLSPRLSLDDAGEVSAAAAAAPVTFQAFDLLYRAGQPLTGWTLRRRKEMLTRLLTPDATVAVPDHVRQDGIAFFEAARQHGLPGMVAKEWESRYLAGRRSRSWLSVKAEQKDEFVIGGFTYGGRWQAGGARSREPFSSLLIGLFDEGGRLQYAGEVTGGSEEMNALQTVAHLDEAVTAECPFAEEPAAGRLVFWCRPELAATVRYAEWTPEGRLRFPVFQALRPDVPADACRRRGDE